MRVLLTGFEPFAGAATNPSWDVARAVAAAWSGPEEVSAVQLPCVFAAAPEALADALATHDPDVVVALGLASGRVGVTPERVAVNLADARIADNSGAQPRDAEVVPGGPTAYFTTLPVKAAVSAVHEAGLPASVSLTAGSYVCNATFYALQHATAGTGTRSGFVHVPDVGDGPGQMSPRDLERAVTAVVRACLDHATDLAVVGGEVS